jgi:energy-converting hydrogenase A subunit B
MVGMKPEFYIVGMVLAIITIQGLAHPTASRLLGKLAQKMGRHTKMT